MQASTFCNLETKPYHVMNSMKPQTEEVFKKVAATYQNIILGTEMINERLVLRVICSETSN